MTTVHAEKALTEDGWQSNVRLEMGAGVLTALSTGAPQPGDHRCQILLPGLPNLHSHAFQRGMAGLAETRAGGEDTFWSWRETMYRFALSVTPDDLEAIAAQLYVEMLEAGFTRVCEFHYLHHDRDGRPYADIAAMAGPIVASARDAGIGLTLLPVYYARAGFGGALASSEQRRFVNDPDRFARLLEGCRSLTAPDPTAVLGVAAHSLRAVTPEELAMAAGLRPGSPFHIHVAEQTKEVDDCLAWCGRRPVEWLLDTEEVDARWCLIHATHMDAAEIARLAGSGAVAGLCPVTEANLGDGVFPGAAFHGAGGRFGVGSDSNVLIGVTDELRQLEYSLRLASRSRNVLGSVGRSTGRALFEAALLGGAQAAGRRSAGITVGAPADLVSLDADHPALLGRSGDAILDSWIFGASRPAVIDVWVAGALLVEAGRHRQRDAVQQRFAATVSRLTELL